MTIEKGFSAPNGYHKRAARIVDRVMPKIKTPHGFFDPEGFIEASRYSGQRMRLYWRTLARLRAKAEGGRPYIAIPKHCEHLWRAGDAMFDVAREMEDAE